MIAMKRSEFEKLYKYRLGMKSDNIDLRRCGNCAHLDRIKGVAEADGCFQMAKRKIPHHEIKVNRERGFCLLWERRENNRETHSC